MEFKVGDIVILLGTRYSSYKKYIGQVMTLTEDALGGFETDFVTEDDSTIWLHPSDYKYELAIPYLNEQKLKKALGL